MTNPMSLLLVLLLVPLVWSALIQMIRHMAGRKPAIFHDRTEKAVMAVMLLPVVTGLAFLAMGPIVTPLNRAHVFYPPVFDEVAQVAVQALPRLTPQGPNLAALGAQAVLILYFAGLAFTLWRLFRSHNRLARIVRTARPTQADRHVLRSEASPLAFAWGAQHIIVPTALFEHLSGSELELVLAHERAHQRRGDPFYFLTLSLIEAVFWFNPLFAQQGRACRLAAELACDAAVVGDEPKVRKAYARALMLALKHASGQNATEAALVPALLSDKEAYKMRLSQILTRAAHPRKAPIWLIGMFTLTAPVLMLQMAFAEGRQWPALALTAPVISAAAPVANGPARLFNTAPVDTAVASGFGLRPDPFTGKTRFHSGVDFNIASGTPIKAPASGIIVANSGQWIPRETAPPNKASGLTPRQNGWWGNYGMVVEIDHGNGVKTRFAHLDKTLVKLWDHVTEGQVIALSGNTGSSTQPHLHFEVWQNEKPVDPATVAALSSQ